MASTCLSPFENPARHAAVSDIIRRRSTNLTDVRTAVLHDLDLSSVRTVLDLGCGFGFMTEAVARRVAPRAEFVGVDACAANEEPYLARLAATGRSGRFVCRRIQAELDWPARRFDLVLASYALYFFPAVLPEMARVLAPGGVLLAVTHRESGCRDLASILGSSVCGARLLALVRRFCAENGPRLLTPWFGTVERVDYENSLVFEAADQEDLLAYLEFKLPLLTSEAAVAYELPAALDAAARTLSLQGRITLDKSDAVFRCRQPRCRGS